MKPFVYNCIVDRVIDGDTVDVHIDLGFNTWLMKRRIRLKGVDTPEIRTRDELEKKFGFLAKSIVEGFCPPGEKILVETEIDNDDKFGRILGTLWVDNGSLNLNQYLIENHYGVAYEGQSKDLIEQAHLENFRYLAENGKIQLD